jgi:outer membrane lipoprotein SlyB
MVATEKGPKANLWITRTVSQIQHVSTRYLPEGFGAVAGAVAGCFLWAGLFQGSVAGAIVGAIAGAVAMGRGGPGIT